MAPPVFRCSFQLSVLKIWVSFSVWMRILLNTFEKEKPSVCMQSSKLKTMLTISSEWECEYLQCSWLQKAPVPSSQLLRIIYTLESLLISLIWKRLWLLFPAGHLDGKFLAGEWSTLEQQSIKLMELGPVVSVLRVGLNIGELYLWALTSCLVFPVGCFYLVF